MGRQFELGYWSRAPHRAHRIGSHRLTQQRGLPPGLVPVLPYLTHPVVTGVQAGDRRKGVGRWVILAAHRVSAVHVACGCIQLAAVMVVEGSAERPGQLLVALPAQVEEQCDARCGVGLRQLGLFVHGTHRETPASQVIEKTLGLVDDLVGSALERTM